MIHVYTCLWRWRYPSAHQLKTILWLIVFIQLTINIALLKWQVTLIINMGSLKIIIRIIGDNKEVFLFWFNYIFDFMHRGGYMTSHDDAEFSEKAQTLHSVGVIHHGSSYIIIFQPNSPDKWFKILLIPNYYRNIIN